MFGKRKFDGLWYHIWDYLPRSKAEAQRKARGFRAKGGKARVVESGRGDWYIFLRG